MTIAEALESLPSYKRRVIEDLIKRGATGPLAVHEEAALKDLASKIGVSSPQQALSAAIRTISTPATLSPYEQEAAARALMAATKSPEMYAAEELILRSSSPQYTPAEREALEIARGFLSQAGQMARYGLPGLEVLAQLAQRPEHQYVSQAAQALGQFLEGPIGSSPLTEAVLKQWDALIRPVIEQSLAAQGGVVPSGAYTEALTRARMETIVPLLQQELQNRMAAAQALGQLGFGVSGLQQQVASTLAGYYPQALQFGSNIAQLLQSLSQGAVQRQLQQAQQLANIASTQTQAGLQAAQQLANLGYIGAERYRSDLANALQAAQQERELAQRAEELAALERQRILNQIGSLYMGWMQNVPVGQRQDISDSGWGLGK